MKKYLIKNGHVIDPANRVDGKADIIISDGKIERVGHDLPGKGCETLDAGGCIVAPGLIDLHVHLREPGREDKETVLTGTRAAAKGGFSTVACMPNTEPSLDAAEVVGLLKDIIKRDAVVKVEPVGAITKSRLGKELVDMHELKKMGVIAFSDDGSSIEDRTLMTSALKNASKEKSLIIAHCEDPSLSGKGVMNAGFTATRMGLRGISKQSEYERVERDIKFAETAKARIHIAHISCKESVDIIREAKRRGAQVTAETAPHYFSLTDECCVTYDTNTKMNPPLRTKDDLAGIKRGLADGTIDCIATDHAPHTEAEKDVEFDFAPFGIIGLETALAISVMELVETKVLSWKDLITKMSVNPAGILGIDGGRIAEGSPADVVIIDPAKEWVYEKGSIESKSANSPFIDWKLKGKARDLFVLGRLVMANGKIII